jgi:predicted protein tyrosine phosphatase
MKIKIMSIQEALAYQPQVPTYAIRIHGKDTYSSLQDSPHYKVIHEYFFLDLNPEIFEEHHGTAQIERVGRDSFFNKEKAKKIISDFEKGREGCLELLVHCHAGVSRSPAIAFALNEIFDLRLDYDSLHIQFTATQKYFYKIMLEARNNKKN